MRRTGHGLFDVAFEHLARRRQGATDNYY